MKPLWIIAAVCVAGFGLGAYMAASSPQFWISMGGALISAIAPVLLKPAKPLTDEQKQRIKDGERREDVVRWPKRKSVIKGFVQSKDMPKK